MFNANLQPVTIHSAAQTDAGNVTLNCDYRRQELGHHIILTQSANVDVYSV